MGSKTESMEKVIFLIFLTLFSCCTVRPTCVLTKHSPEDEQSKTIAIFYGAQSDASFDCQTVQNVYPIWATKCECK